MKTLQAVLFVVFLIAVYFTFIHKSCVEPDKETIGLTALICLDDVVKDPVKLRNDICVEMGKYKDCIFSPKDVDIVQRLFDKRVMNCAKDRLEKDNLCTDKVKFLIEVNQ